jgi:hypothetical protein
MAIVREGESCHLRRIGAGDVTAAKAEMFFPIQDRSIITGVIPAQTGVALQQPNGWSSSDF